MNVQRFYPRVFASVLAVGQSCFAGDYLSTHDNKIQAFQHHRYHATHLVPVHQMEDHILFRAAGVERENTLSEQQRRLNHFWLRNGSQVFYSGGEALRQVARRYLKSYWQTRQQSKIQRGVLPVVEQRAPSQFTDVSNYRVRVSDSKFLLRFRYRFN